MKQITAAEFKAHVRSNPSWAATLTEPVEVTGFCHMEATGITHLSPWLHFTGRNPRGNTANFQNCPNLKVAEGNFAGTVHFQNSGIEKIGRLHINSPNKKGEAATFYECQSLKIAEGTFPGAVDFASSGIEKIGDLRIKRPDDAGWAADFAGCDKLTVAEGTFPGFVNFACSGIKKVGKLETQPNKEGYRACFNNCNLPFTQEFLGDEFDMEESTRQKNLRRIAVHRAHKAQPELEI